MSGYICIEVVEYWTTYSFCLQEYTWGKDCSSSVFFLLASFLADTVVSVCSSHLCKPLHTQFESCSTADMHSSAFVGNHQTSARRAFHVCTLTPPINSTHRPTYNPHFLCTCVYVLKLADFCDEMLDMCAPENTVVIGISVHSRLAVPQGNQLDGFLWIFYVNYLTWAFPCVITCLDDDMTLN